MSRTTITVNLQMTVNTVPQLMAALDALENREVLVGVPEDKDARNDGEMTNAQIAAINNFGSPAQNIPAREFMESGVNDVRDRVERGLVKAGGAALDGNMDALDRGLEAVGLIAATSIKKRISTGPFAPLAPSTLAARRSRGRSGTKPLQDTGALRNSISYVVRKRRR